MSLSLYRKYRPVVFSDVVGQEHVIRTLSNAVAEGNVAHAYLFCGPRGTGKTTTARLLAKALLCEKGPTAQPDGTCQECADIAAGSHPDVYELDAASRTGVENVREEIISRVQFAPTRGSRKVYIIDEVHMLSVPAFNALLKTLEEPPEHVVFIMCTTDPHKVLETVQSRCQRFDFHRFSVAEIVTYLQRICEGEGFSFDCEALELIAAKANGGMRDATTSLEQVAVASNGCVDLAAAQSQLGQVDQLSLFDLAHCVASRDVAKAFEWVDMVVSQGVDLVQCAGELAAHFRNLYVAALAPKATGLIQGPKSLVARYVQQAAAFGGTDRLCRAMTVCGDVCIQLKSAQDARLCLEIALTKLCRPESDLTLESLAERIESLELRPSAPIHQADARGQEGVPSHAETAVQHMFGAGIIDDVTCRADEPVMHSAEAQGADVPALGNALAASVDSVVGNAPAVDLPWDVPESMGEAAGAKAEAPIAESPVRQVVSSAQESSAVSSETAGAPSSNVEMSPARVMAAVLTDIKRHDVATAALLNGVELAKDAAGYHLMFPNGGGFAMRIASHGEAHEILSNAFCTVLGPGVAFDCRGCGQASKEEGPTFAAVSAQEAAAPSSFVDEGYEAAQAAYADLAAASDSYYDDGFDATPAQASAQEYVPETASSAAGNVSNEQPNASSSFDPLSVFGSGIKVEEI